MDLPGHLVHTEAVMGTVASFRVVCPGVAPETVRSALAEACAGLHEVDRVFSTWSPGSPLSRYRRGEIGFGELPPEVGEVAERCEEARALSDGWFDPWAAPGGFDPTGLVKGWAVERAVARLATDAPAGMVNVGGDLAVWGQPEPGEMWTVAVRHPGHPDAAAFVLRVERAVATSGDYERGPHLYDPFSGRPQSRVPSATVTGPGLALADALATALAVAGEEGLAFVARAVGYEGAVIGGEGEGLATPGFSRAVVDAVDPVDPARSEVVVDPAGSGAAPGTAPVAPARP